MYNINAYKCNFYLKFMTNWAYTIWKREYDRAITFVGNVSRKSFCIAAERTSLADLADAFHLNLNEKLTLDTSDSITTIPALVLRKSEGPKGDYVDIPVQRGELFEFERALSILAELNQR